MFTIFYGDCKVFRKAIFTRIVKIRQRGCLLIFTATGKAFVDFRFLQQFFVFFNPTIANVGLS